MRLHPRRTSPAAVALITAFALLALLACSGSALASKTATAAQLRALTRAIRTTPVAGIDKIPANRYRVSRAKISTVSTSWASAWVEPTKRFQATLQGIEVVAVKPGGTSTWVVVDAGTAEVGCGIAPNAVLADLLGLKAGEQPCPPGEGIS
jgi:ABC-type glycerol-3-phosphate transport system substrate-binding protein